MHDVILGGPVHGGKHTVKIELGRFFEKLSRGVKGQVFLFQLTQQVESVWLCRLMKIGLHNVTLSGHKKATMAAKEFSCCLSMEETNWAVSNKKSHAIITIKYSLKINLSVIFKS